MFQAIQAHLDELRGGVLQLDNVTIYDTDNETLFAQLDTIVELVRRRVQELGCTTEDVPSGQEGLSECEYVEDGEEADEELGEEDDSEQVQGRGGLVTDDPEEQRNIEMLIQMGEAADSAESEDGEAQPARQLSEYEKKKQRLYEQIQRIEDDLVREKSWRMKGEATAEMRERDELVKDLPEFQLKRRQRVVMDEALIRSIEDVVRQRVLDQNYDNVVFEQKREVRELKDVATEKDAKGLDQVLTEQKVGERVQLTELQQKQQRRCLEAYGLLETELRSYFVNGTFTK